MASKKSRKSKHLLATLVTEKKAPCAFCQRKVDDEITFGKLYAIGDIQCHYFCVLLSCCLIQKGRDDEGLFGFLYPDILAEIERSKKHKCSYCSKEGATLGCCISQCRKQFHLPCGRERNAVSLFYGNYKSYCQLHAPKQKIPDHIMATAKLRMKQAKNSKNLRAPKNFSILKELCAESPVKDAHPNEDTESICLICYEEVDGFPSLQTFWPPCCARDAWFHRTCLQRMALSAGMHYLKCPLCNDKDSFYEAVVSQGYYVPDRDAAWELEQNAFAEIYERALSCSAEDCQCPLGRRHDADTGMWDIKLCVLCGMTGVHARCLAGAGLPARLVCDTCRPAAPNDLEALVTSVEAVIRAEQAQSATSARRRGPVMPSRMSLRRTKQRVAYNTPSTSKTDIEKNEAGDQARKTNTTSSRLELNLKTPKKPVKTENPLEPVLADIENRLLSPTKLLERGLTEKIRSMGVKEMEVDSNVLERAREKFKKPRPLSVKKRIVNNLLESLFDNLLKENPKTKEPIKEWSSPKKCCDYMQEDMMESTQENIDPEAETIKMEPSANTESPNNTNNHPSAIFEEEIQDYCNKKLTKLSEEEIKMEIEDIKSIKLEDSSIRETKDDPKELVNNFDEDTTDKFEEYLQQKFEEIPMEIANVFEETQDLNLKGLVEQVKEFETPGISKDEDFNLDPNVKGLVDQDKGIETPGISKDEDSIQDPNVKGLVDEVKGIETPGISKKKDSNQDANVNESVEELKDLETPGILKDEDSNSSSSSFQLPAEFIADLISDDSIELCETPKKLKTVDIEKDSSLEISENDQIVNIDVVKMANETDTDSLKLTSPVKTKKCVFKFSPINKDTLRESKLDIDLESFKNQYLNEVDRDFKCKYDHKHKHVDGNCNSPNKLRTAIDFALEAYQKENGGASSTPRDLKRKTAAEEVVPKKKKKKGKNCVLRYKKKDSKIKLKCSKEEDTKNITETIDVTVNGDKNVKTRKKFKKNKKIRENIQVKIKWRKERLQLKITKSKTKNKKIKEKPKEKALKQYILKYSPEVTSSKNMLIKPENDVTPIKRKYNVKQETTPADKMKQTSIQNFFKVKDAS